MRLSMLSSARVLRVGLSFREGRGGIGGGIATAMHAKQCE